MRKRDRNLFTQKMRIINGQQQTVQIITNDQKPYTYTKKHMYASNVTTDEDQTVYFGLPKFTQTVYPGQTTRINCGWKLSSIPTNSSVSIMPNQQLIDNGIISLPKIYTQSKQNQQVSQPVYNSNKFPVVFEYNQQQDNFNIYFIDESNLKIKQLRFDIDRFFQGILGAAAHIVPLFF